MYIADWSFQKRLKKQDSKLFAKWIHKDPRGRVKDRWAIFRIQPSDNKLYNRYWMVMWVQNEDGSYRPLDERTLRALRQADTHVRGVNTIVDEAISEQEKTQEAIQAADRADLKDMVKELPRSDLAKKAEEDGIGVSNIPKEDIEAQLVAQYGEEALETFA